MSMNYNVPFTRTRPIAPLAAVLVLILGLAAGGCRNDMHDQPRFNVFEANPFYPDSQSARPLVEGTVARGHLRLDPAFYTGKLVAPGAIIERGGENVDPNFEGPSALRREYLQKPEWMMRSKEPLNAEGESAQVPAAGSVRPRYGVDLPNDVVLEPGMDRYVRNIPMQVTRQVLLRGREKFNIYCSPCHGRTGLGNGMIVQRGFKHPPSYYDPHLRNAPAGYLFDVITNGFGVMYSYSSRVAPEDRWAIIAYIRTLQYSFNAPVDVLSPEQRQHLTTTAEADTNQ